jgi:hypothetical protein
MRERTGPASISADTSRIPTHAPHSEHGLPLEALAWS